MSILLPFRSPLHPRRTLVDSKNWGICVLVGVGLQVANKGWESENYRVVMSQVQSAPLGFVRFIPLSVDMDVYCHVYPRPLRSRTLSTAVFDI